MKRGTKRASRARVGTAAFMGVIALTFGAIGTAGTAIALRQDVPASLRPAAKVDSVPVETTSFADERELEVSLTESPGKSLIANEVGVLTSDSCVPGGQVTSGKVAYSVNGKPVLALAMSAPLWRDLSPGDQGADVLAVQEALAGLGTGIQPDGVLGQDALDAFAALNVENGFPLRESKKISWRQILWLPSKTVALSACELSIGMSVTEGAKYATAAGGLSAASVSIPPGESAPGERRLLIGNTEFALSPEGRVRQEDLPKISALQGYRDAVRESDPVPMSGVWHLVTPVKAASVPARALTDIDGSAACIWQGSKGFSVQIIGSQLGQTLVRPADKDAQLPAAVSLQHRSRGESCRK